METRAEKVIALMRRAAEVTRAVSTQHGYLVELPAQGDLFITGDLHGNLNNLQRIVQIANLKSNPGRHVILQELVHELESFDHICRSHRLVEAVAFLKTRFPEHVHVLLGNHEFSELLDLEIGKRGQGLNQAFEDGLRSAYGERWQDVKNAFRVFWQSCPVAVRTETRLFISHSTPKLDRLNNLDLDFLRKADHSTAISRDGPVFSMLWDRDYREEAAEAFALKMDADVILVGHTACPRGICVPNSRHIILDSKDFEGRYILLPLSGPLTQRQVVAYSKKLFR